MELPTLESAKELLASSQLVRQKILRIAKRLEAVNEYSAEQALLVAADIVRTRFLKGKDRNEGVIL